MVDQPLAPLAFLDWLQFRLDPGVVFGLLRVPLCLQLCLPSTPGSSVGLDALLGLFEIGICAFKWNQSSQTWS